jgi:hypothetical protein
MARISKEQRESRLYRERIQLLVAESHGWRDHEHIRYWLQKLLRREPDDTFTEAERTAVDRIISARSRLYEGWAGFTVPELRRAARRYIADFGYDDELFLDDIDAEDATRLVEREMRHLVSLCIMSGMDIPRIPLRWTSSE